MSRARTLGSPIRRPSSAAPQKPLAGPDSTIVIGIRFVFSTVSTPVFDWSTYSWPWKPAPRTPSASRVRYRSATGWTYAERTAVLVRSYSRHSRVI